MWRLEVSNECGAPRPHDRAACGDADQASKQGVASVSELVEAAAAEARWEEALGEETGDAADRAGERRSDGRAGHVARRAMQVEGGAGVEPVPDITGRRSYSWGECRTGAHAMPRTIQTKAETCRWPAAASSGPRTRTAFPNGLCEAPAPKRRRAPTSRPSCARRPSQRSRSFHS